MIRATTFPGKLKGELIQGGVKKREDWSSRGLLANINAKFLISSIGVEVVNDTNTIEFIVAHNITGLQPCSNCNITVALSDSEECTKETYSGAKGIPLKDVLTYTANDEGSTGLKKTVISANMEHPAVVSFVETIKSEYEDPTSQVLGASVFLTNQDGDLVACAFLKAPTSDEEKETVYNILFGLGEAEGEEGTSGVDDAAPSTLGDATSPGNHWLTSIIAIGVAAASTLLLAVNA